MAVIEILYRLIGFREHFFFFKLTNQKQYCLWKPCLLTDRTKWAIFINDLTEMFPTKFRFIWLSGFKGEPTRKNNCLWRPCLLMDRNKMSNLYRCFLPNVSSFAQAISEKKIFRNWPTRNKHCLCYSLLPTIYPWCFTQDNKINNVVFHF